MKKQPYANLGREACERIARQIAETSGLVTQLATVKAAPSPEQVPGG